MISEEGLKKFRDLYFSKYGVKLSKKDAQVKFSELIGVVKIAYVDNDR